MAQSRNCALWVLMGITGGLMGCKTSSSSPSDAFVQDAPAATTPLDADPGTVDAPLEADVGMATGGTGGSTAAGGDGGVASGATGGAGLGGGGTGGTVGRTGGSGGPGGTTSAGGATAGRTGGGTAGRSGGSGGRAGTLTTGGTFVGGTSGGTGGTGGGGAGGAIHSDAGVAPPANAKYVGIGGSDSNPGTSDRPWATFAFAFRQMSAGDTLIIKDGTYTEPIIGYYNDGIPSGTAARYTVVKAEHDFRVLIDGSHLTGNSGTVNPLLLNQRSYVRVEGIKFKSSPSGEREAGFIDGHHIKIIRCAFFDAPDHENLHTVTVLPGSQYVLFEECWAWGSGRYKFHTLQTDKVVFRRCVGRHDRHTSPSNARPQAVFNPYMSTDTVIENCIALDSDQDAYYLVDGIASEYPFRGGFYFPNGSNGGSRILGSIALKLSGWAGVINEYAEGTQEVKNTIVWDSRGGIYYIAAGTSPTSVAINHATVGGVWGTPEDGFYAWGGGAYATVGFTSARMTNSLMTQNKSFGVADWMQSDYNDFFKTGQSYMQIRYEAKAPTAGTNDRYDDPGLLQLPLAGTNAALKGSDGRSMGATVMYRYGVSETLWGDPGYDTLLEPNPSTGSPGEPLWPFPNEAEIKKDMASYAGPPSGQRGFCAPGTGRYGGDITLTSYIWEYLGQPCPKEYCK